MLLPLLVPVPVLVPAAAVVIMAMFPLWCIDQDQDEAETTARTKTKIAGYATTKRKDGTGPRAELKHPNPIQQKVILSFARVAQGIDAEKLPAVCRPV